MRAKVNETPRICLMKARMADVPPRFCVRRERIPRQWNPRRVCRARGEDCLEQQTTAKGNRFIFWFKSAPINKSVPFSRLRKARIRPLDYFPPFRGRAAIYFHAKLCIFLRSMPCAFPLLRNATICSGLPDSTHLLLGDGCFDTSSQRDAS